MILNLCLTFLAVIFVAVSAITYYDSPFAVDFKSETLIYSGSSGIPIGSFAAYHKKVTVTFETEQDPYNCITAYTYISGSSDTGGGFGPKQLVANDSLTLSYTFNNNDQFFYGWRFWASASNCNVNVKASSVSFD